MLIRRPLRRLAADRRGGVSSVMVIFSIGLMLTLGLVADLGRAYAERTRLQAWLDSLAVAVAGQLDGRPDALERADWVLRNAEIAGAGIHSQASLSTGSEADSGAGFQVSEVIYLSDAPAQGFSSMTLEEIRAYETADPTEADFVYMQARQETVPFTALALMSTTSSAEAPAYARVGARATAMPIPGYSCGAPIIAVCVPPDRLDDVERPGVQLKLRKNLDGVWEPGEYGVVTDIPASDDRPCEMFEEAERLACQLAVQAPGDSCPATVDMRAGDGIEVGGAMNTRFDIWSDGVDFLRGHPDIASDVNTITGTLYDCDGAVYDTVSDSMGLPEDPCFHNGTCGFVSPEVLPAELDLYWSENHGGSMPFMPESRYEVYLYEILEGFLDPEGPEDSTENLCNPNAEPEPERRMVNVALVDCTDLETLQLSEVPVAGQIEGLLTSPVLDTTNAIVTFDGVHQNEFMQAGDIVRQDFDPAQPGPGNPGNDKAVGNAGEAPNGDPCWGSGSRGISDSAPCVFDVVLDRDSDGAGSNNGDFSEFVIDDVQIFGDTGLMILGLRDDGEWVRIDRIEFERTGDLDTGPGNSGNNGNGNGNGNGRGNGGGNGNNGGGGGSSDAEGGATTLTLEAEDMERDNFREVSGNRASGRRLVRLPDDEGLLIQGGLDLAEGSYRVRVHAQDETDGQSTIRLTFTHEAELPLWPEHDLRVTDDRGRLTYDPYRHLGLMRIHVHQSERADKPAWRNVPMLFDTSAPTGGDEDLASTQFGNVLIVSEDGDADDPDDEARGGWLVFHFDRPTTIHALTVFDTEEGGVIRVYDEVTPDPGGEFHTEHDGDLDEMRWGEEHDPRELAHFAVPRLGDGKHVRMRIDTENVRTIAYFLPDSGAIDNLEFSNELTEPVLDDRITLEAVRRVGGAIDYTAVIFD